MILDDRHLGCFLHFIEDELPEVYIIPATAWKKPNEMFVDRNYDKPGQKSKPEWGINYSKKNLYLLKKYTAANYFNKQ